MATQHAIKAEGGFSMIEVLVTMIVIAIALLGSAGLQAYALKTNLGGQYRNQAAFLVSDIVDRMEANKTAVLNGNYALAAGAAAPTALSTACQNALCSDAQLAQYDVTNWQFNVSQNLPQGTASIVANGASTYTIVVNWVERTSNANAAAQTENFSITTTRTIALDRG